MKEKVFELVSILENEVNALREVEDSTELENLHRSLSEYLTVKTDR